MSRTGIVEVQRLREFRAYVAGYLESAASLICIVQESIDTPETDDCWNDVRRDLEMAKSLLDHVALRVSPISHAESEINLNG